MAYTNYALQSDFQQLFFKFFLPVNKKGVAPLVKALPPLISPNFRLKKIHFIKYGLSWFTYNKP